MNRFKKYETMEVKNNYWGEFNLKNTEDKLIFSLQKFFNILNEETKVNEKKSIKDRVAPIESTKQYLEDSLAQIIILSKQLEKRDIGKLCQVYSLFLYSQGWISRNSNFPIVTPYDFKKSSYACSVTFLLTRYYSCKKLVNESSEVIENFLNNKKNNDILEIKDISVDDHANRLANDIAVREDISAFIESIARLESVDLDKVVLFLLADNINCNMDIEWLFGTNILNQALKNEEVSALFDYKVSIYIPVMMYWLNEEDLNSDVLKKLPPNLFEKSYVNFQKHSDKIESLSVTLPTFYQKYRKEQLSKILEETEGSKNESRVKPKI